MVGQWVPEAFRKTLLSLKLEIFLICAVNGVAAAVISFFYLILLHFSWTLNLYLQSCLGLA